MNETRLEDLRDTMLKLKNANYESEVTISEETRKYAYEALKRMFEV